MRALPKGISPAAPLGSPAWGQRGHGRDRNHTDNISEGEAEPEVARLETLVVSPAPLPEDLDLGILKFLLKFKFKNLGI